MRDNPFNFKDKDYFIERLMLNLQNQLLDVDELMCKASDAEAKEDKYKIYLEAALLVESMFPLAPLYFALMPEGEANFMAKTFDELQSLLEENRNKQQEDNHDNERNS